MYNLLTDTSSLYTTEKRDQSSQQSFVSLSKSNHKGDKMLNGRNMAAGGKCADVQSTEKRYKY